MRRIGTKKTHSNRRRVSIIVILALMALQACATAEGTQSDFDQVPTAAQTPTTDSSVETAEPTASGLLDVRDYPTATGRLFNDSSPFNQRIPGEPSVHPDSDELISALSQRTPDGIVISIDHWTVSAFIADESTPRTDVRLTADWAPYGVLRDVPIPAEAKPDPEDDGHMAIIDRSGGYVYDFWQAQETAGGWEASWANRTSLAGDGVYPHGLSARGSGFSLLAGLIWPTELENESIDHALVFTYKPNKSGVLVEPATETDGASVDPLTLPEGARLQLNPDLDLDSLELTPTERAIAVALQEYGMILGDTGGTSIVELEIVHPFSFGMQSFSDLDLEIDEGFAYLWKIPLDEFRVIDYVEIDAELLDIRIEDESIFAE